LCAVVFCSLVGCKTLEIWRQFFTPLFLSSSNQKTNYVMGLQVNFSSIVAGFYTTISLEFLWKKSRR